MGERGPVGKRSDRKLGHTSKAEREAVERVEDPFVVVVPEGDPEWHPVALGWFESLKASGQSQFYASSDWATAVLLAESISRELSPQPVVVGKGDDARVEMLSFPPKGASLAAWLRGMTALLVTEGDRRRAALELQRPAPERAEEAGSVSSLDAWRGRVDGTG